MEPFLARCEGGHGDVDDLGLGPGFWIYPSVLRLSDICRMKMISRLWSIETCKKTLFQRGMDVTPRWTVPRWVYMQSILVGFSAGHAAGPKQS